MGLSATRVHRTSAPGLEHRQRQQLRPAINSTQPQRRASATSRCAGSIRAQEHRGQRSPCSTMLQQFVRGSPAIIANTNCRILRFHPDHTAQVPGRQVIDPLATG